MPNEYALPAEVTIYTLGALHQEFLSWLKSVSKLRGGSKDARKPWLVDASQVSEVDASGVQLLLSLSHSLAKKQRALRLTNASITITNACRSLGVMTLLEMEGSPGTGA